VKQMSMEMVKLTTMSMSPFTLHYKYSILHANHIFASLLNLQIRKGEIRFATFFFFASSVVS
jgi:hypothetical protein